MPEGNDSINNNDPQQPQDPAQPPSAITPEEAQRLQENVSQFRQYEKQYKAQIAELKSKIKGYEQSQAQTANAEAEAEKARLAEQEKWRELAEKTQADHKTAIEQLESLRSELDQTRRTTITVDLAREFGAINPTDLNFREAVAEVDISAGDNEAREQIRSIIERMKESHAYLFKTASDNKDQPKPGLPGFNPSGDGAQMSDAQRIARLKQLTGQGHWDMFGSQTTVRK
jgi:multidrug efflux pump subunit AcrA (membrane-fusion protein)